ncbi:MAG: rod shape-determining protein MreD [Lachnospiraceae bacterium]|jgi:rod shape-determining protein MreD|nr:rod shape-determining protein MreD [Lachnospiraceae bacterium]
MLRKIIEIGLSIICFVLQITLFKSLEIGSVSPNLLVILVAAIGFMNGKREGIFIGFISGLYVDLYFPQVLGLYALLYMMIGYFNGCFRKEFFPDDIKLPMIMIALSDLMLNIIIYVLLFLFRGDLKFAYYIANIMVPELVYTLVVSILLYLIILKINQRLESYEKRRASKFG